MCIQHLLCATYKNQFRYLGDETQWTDGHTVEQTNTDTCLLASFMISYKKTYRITSIQVGVHCNDVADIIKIK